MAGATLDRFETRPVQPADLDDVASLFDAVDLALGIPPDPIREAMAWKWSLPTTDLERDTRIVRDRDAIAAYAEALWERPDEA